ncbi:MAG: hypothetical protein QXT39_02380 [Conexivisphaerales archaeon]
MEAVCEEHHPVAWRGSICFTKATLTFPAGIYSSGDLGNRPFFPLSEKKY